MQDALYHLCNHKRHRFMVPNVQVFGWESDLISVTRDDFVYEIKISRKDFLQDLSKERHRHLLALHAGEAAGLWPDASTPVLLAASGASAETRNGANYLYYAAPKSLLTIDDIPVHAGFIVVNSSGIAEIVRPAPKLHKDKLPERNRQWLERSLTSRFWSARLKGNSLV